ncbi:MAG: hypothetical protein Kow0077_15300 [Anaerolineae bacterium]
MQHKRTAGLRHFLRRLLLIDLVMFAGTGIVCWVGGWRTWTDYGNGLFIACAAVLAFALASAYGGWMTTSGFTYQYASTASHDRAHEHARRALRDRNEGIRLILQAGLICILPLIVAALLQGNPL